MTNVLLLTFLADVMFQLFGFCIAAFLQTEKFYDLAGSATFLLCTYLSLFKPWESQVERQYNREMLLPFTKSEALATSENGRFHARQVLASGTTGLWALYLGAFLFKRALHHGDRRFDKVKKNPRQFLLYWLVQATWVALTALPVYLTNAIPAQIHSQIRFRDILGLILWAGGFVFEVAANYQKEKWRKEIGPDYKRSFISHGLWSLSRHPNYFGECVLWFGSFLLCSSAFPAALQVQLQLQGAQTPLHHTPAAGLVSAWLLHLAFFSPIFVTVLITRVSGIPLLERENDRRLKDVVAYWRYKKQTSMFVPTWPRNVGLE
ncbi:hypothetical protein BGW38_006092 [Lunasporangiospora selenospora]|uniref:Steroid 5-alpha reductase C-terminal domain-containing protein n=1 Tax=Lunasporangiospora selenospora TaxID=979761 RepID=A0A9P6FP42_9FUNG|nr:hypothetical protein BGW38_006092 [Lunasporangiospora selenospora]